MFNLKNAKWFFEPKKYYIEENTLEIETEPKTDFWQRTYYNFQNDNAPVLYNSIKDEYFTFTVKTNFNSKNLFDQCGIAIYQNSENWIKVGTEYKNEEISWLGSVVTNNGYSDWATTEIKSTKEIWYRISRRKSDYLIENSYDGINFYQMRIFHLNKGDELINLGLCACSPGESSFIAKFTEISLSQCLWKEHK